MDETSLHFLHGLVPILYFTIKYMLIFTKKMYIEVSEFNFVVQRTMFIYYRLYLCMEYNTHHP